MAPRMIAAIRHSAVIAALLSFLWPGLGQGWVGSRRRAILFAVPMMLFLGAGLLVMIVQGKARALGLLLQPGVLLLLLALNLAILVYRLFAIVDAYRDAARRWPSVAEKGRAAIGLVLLGVVLGGTLLMHGWLGFVGFKTYDTVVAVSHPFSSPTPLPAASLAPGETPGPTPVPTPIGTPEPAWGDNGRLDLLLIGADAGPGRYSLRTDTMVILSIEVSTGRAAMFGVPRNLINVPLPADAADAFDCGCFPDLLNGLFRYASEHPEEFPGSDDERGYRAVQEAIAKLTGLQIDGQVVVTLGGFVRLVDALGGLEMTTKDSIFDARYPDPLSTHNVTLYIPKGFHHFDGWHALAYARSRHQDNDYNRMNRQQEVLVAMRQQLDPCTLISRIPELLDIARDSLWTNIPLERLPDLFEIGARVRPGSIVSYQFWPPEIKETLDFASINKVRLMVRNPFSDAPVATPRPSSSAKPAPGPGSIC
ncbi:MAG TPA: LCP family protein [Methylomirabilota bacterium]|nr:LCP family protein [Methylomirabilota bacterium]